MKIAMLTNNYRPFVGGVPISVERLAGELRRAGHDVTVFAPDYGRHEQCEEQGVIRFEVTRRKMENGMVYPKLISRKILEEFKKSSEKGRPFECIHVHQPMFVGTTGLYLGKKYDIPVIYTYHTRYEDYLHYISLFRSSGPHGRIKRELLYFAREKVIPTYMRWFTNQCDMVLAPTAGMQKRIRENGTKVPMAVMPTGLEDSFFTMDRQRVEQIRAMYTKGRENVRLLCSVSRLEEEKNPEFLIEGIRCIKKKSRQEIRVLLIGDGSMRTRLEKMARESGLEDTIVFTGNIPNEEVKYYLGASEVFLFASKSETQGIVLEEAMAAGCPVVALQASGVEDIVRNGINGYMTAEDTEEWSSRVLQILADDTREKMCTAAQETASGFRASRLALYAKVLYTQCIENRKDERENYERRGENKGDSAGSIFKLFKTS